MLFQHYNKLSSIPVRIGDIALWQSPLEEFPFCSFFQQTKSQTNSLSISGDIWDPLLMTLSGKKCNVPSYFTLNFNQDLQNGVMYSGSISPNSIPQLKKIISYKSVIQFYLDNKRVSSFIGKINDMNEALLYSSYDIIFYADESTISSIHINSSDLIPLNSNYLKIHFSSKWLAQSKSIIHFQKSLIYLPIILLITLFVTIKKLWRGLACLLDPYVISIQKPAYSKFLLFLVCSSSMVLLQGLFSNIGIIVSSIVCFLLSRTQMAYKLASKQSFLYSFLGWFVSSIFEVFIMAIFSLRSKLIIGVFSSVHTLSVFAIQIAISLLITLCEYILFRKKNSSWYDTSESNNRRFWIDTKLMSSVIFAINSFPVILACHHYFYYFWLYSTIDKISFISSAVSSILNSALLTTIALALRLYSGLPNWHWFSFSSSAISTFMLVFGYAIHFYINVIENPNTLIYFSLSLLISTAASMICGMVSYYAAFGLILWNSIVGAVYPECQNKLK